MKPQARAIRASGHFAVIDSSLGAETQKISI
jgi:hypothetical protein